MFRLGCRPWHAKESRQIQVGSRECIYGTSVEYCLDPEISLLLKKAGFDLFFIDTEHQAATYKDIRAICPTARDFDIAALVRVYPKRTLTDYTSIGLWRDGRGCSSRSHCKRSRSGYMCNAIHTGGKPRFWNA